MSRLPGACGDTAARAKTSDRGARRGGYRGLEAQKLIIQLFSSVLSRTLAPKPQCKPQKSVFQFREVHVQTGECGCRCHKLIHALVLYVFDQQVTTGVIMCGGTCPPSLLLSLVYSSEFKAQCVHKAQSYRYPGINSFGNYCNHDVPAASHVHYTVLG